MGGTELCGHTDGRCFCKGNRFGLRCELLCPFGYINHTCLTAPIGSACQCPNDLYTCDLALGCICPEGVDCGLEVIDRTVELSVCYKDIVKKKQAPPTNMPASFSPAPNSMASLSIEEGA